MTNSTPNPTQPAASTDSQNEIPPAPTTSQILDRRATTLTKAYTGALDATFKKLTYDNFSSCFPTAAEYRPDVLKRFWRDFVDKLGEKCNKEFETVLAERDVIPSLNALDALIRDALARKTEAQSVAEGSGQPVKQPIPPHMLPPETLMAHHLAPFLKSQDMALRNTLGSLEEQNVELGKVIAEQHAEMERLVSGLEARVADLKGAAEMVQDEELVRLTSEVGMVRSELRNQGS